MTTTSQPQYFLKSLLLLQTIAVLIYTIITIQNEGFVFLKRALEFVQTMQWIGQFALDFGCYLILSALWIAWRNQFSWVGILMASAASILGIIVFAPYLLFLINKENGSIKRVLIGER